MLGFIFSKGFQSMFLVFTFLLFFKIHETSDAQYGPETNYDSHPYPVGWLDEVDKADFVCAAFNRRFCSSRDLNISLSIGMPRSFCGLSWAYDYKLKKTRGFMNLSPFFPCFFDRDTTKNFPMPPSGRVFPEIYDSSGIDTYVCFAELEDKKKDYDCTGSGTDYRGYITRTETDKKCQWWEIQSPNSHTETPSNPKFRYLQKNYCRNPDGSNRPWCYLADSVGREYCNITCRAYGEFDSCKVSLYSEEDLEGSDCAISVSEMSYTEKYFSKNCGFHPKSVELSGSFCFASFFTYFAENAMLQGNSVLMNFKDKNISNQIEMMFLMDISSDVVLGNYQDYSSVRNFHPVLKNVRICSSIEVDHAFFIYKEHRDGPNLGYVLENSVQNVYSHENMLPAYNKQTWCCLNERPELLPGNVLRSEARGKCAEQTRSETVKVLGVLRTYTRKRRICTINDLMRHFHYMDKDFPIGFVAVNESFVLLMKRNLGVLVKDEELETGKPWCCDEDCYPLFFRCKENSNCCTNKCVENVCVDPNVDDVIHETIFTPGSQKFRRLLTIVILVTSLYLLGWVMRFCCPVRRGFDRHIKID